MDLGISYLDAFSFIRGFSPCCWGDGYGVLGKSVIESLIELNSMYNSLHMRFMEKAEEELLGSIEGMVKDLLRNSVSTPGEYGGMLDDMFWEEGNGLKDK